MMRSKKALRNIIANILLQIAIIVNGFIVPKIIIDHFGSETNGLISSITQFLAYITLLESGFGPVVKSALYKPLSEKNKESIGRILKTTEIFFRRIALIFILYILVLCIVFPFINDGFNWLFTASLIVIIGLSTFAEYFFGMTYNLFLQAKQEKYVISSIQIITYIISTAAVVVMAKMGANVHLIKLVSGLIFIVRPIIQNYYVRKKYHLDLRWVKGTVKLNKKWDALAQHIAYVIHTKTYITVLTIFTNFVEVSVYSVYYLVVKGIKSIIQAFSAGIDSTFGDMISKNEIDNLNKKFTLYELLYGTINVIVFTSTIVLIVPFITVYTKGVEDADYIRPLFGALIVISEYTWAIRQPYNLLVQAAGHFRETRRGAWVECLSNIIISIILVKWLGIVGVAIGTIIAMTIRTIEFVYHANKYILKRSIWESVKKIILAIIETVAIVVICRFLPFVENNSYLNWMINALMTVGVAGLVVLGLNALFFNKEFVGACSLIKSLAHKRKNK